MSVTEHRTEGETPSGPIIESVYELMTDLEAASSRAYLTAYRIEFERVSIAGREDDLVAQRFWSQLAHSAGDLARRRMLKLDGTER